MLLMQLLKLLFQSTHPRGVRPSLCYQSPCRYHCFNPRTRVGCDKKRRRRNSSDTEFQSTHPRGVRHIQNLSGFLANKVSIHAPAWGATKTSLQKFCTVYVSIHAPAWGATSAAAISAATREAFQSTHPRGVRRYYFACVYCALQVSIHAPAWGATNF